MSDEGGIDGDASEIHGSKALVSGSNAAWRHKQTLEKILKRYVGAHPGCRVQFCIQSAYANDIALLFTHNMGGPANAKLVQNGLVQRCAELSHRKVVLRLRRELAGATPEQCNVGLKAVELAVSEGILGAAQAKWMINMMQGFAAEDPGGELLAATRRYRAPFCCHAIDDGHASCHFTAALNVCTVAADHSMMEVGARLPRSQRTATQAAGTDDAEGDAGMVAPCLPGA